MRAVSAALGVLLLVSTKAYGSTGLGNSHCPPWGCIKKKDVMTVVTAPERLPLQVQIDAAKTGAAITNHVIHDPTDRAAFLVAGPTGVMVAEAYKQVTAPPVAPSVSKRSEVPATQGVRTLSADDVASVAATVLVARWNRMVSSPEQEQRFVGQLLDRLPERGSSFTGQVVSASRDRLIEITRRVADTSSAAYTSRSASPARAPLIPSSRSVATTRAGAQPTRRSGAHSSIATTRNGKRLRSHIQRTVLRGARANQRGAGNRLRTPTPARVTH